MLFLNWLHIYSASDCNTWYRFPWEAKHGEDVTPSSHMVSHHKRLHAGHKSCLGNRLKLKQMAPKSDSTSWVWNSLTPLPAPQINTFLSQVLENICSKFCVQIVVLWRDASQPAEQPNGSRGCRDTISLNSCKCWSLSQLSQRKPRPTRSWQAAGNGGREKALTFKCAAVFPWVCYFRMCYKYFWMFVEVTSACFIPDGFGFGRWARMKSGAVSVS